MKIKLILASILLVGCVNTALALPALQLGGEGAGWSYDTGDNTWVVSGTDNFTLSALANCTGTQTGCDSPNGDYAWDATGSANQYAYLIVAAVPDSGSAADAFDVSIVNDGGATLVAMGHGTPPIQDPNSIAGHGIYDTYFEIYEFQFDGSIGTIGNTQPGDSGTGDGYSESFDITVNSMVDSLTGLHFDLFTVSGARYDPNDEGSDRDLMEAFAPPSHDAEYECCSRQVPAPGAAFLFGLGLLALVGMRKKLS